jgi:hypothetical protein
MGRTRDRSAMGRCQLPGHRGTCRRQNGEHLGLFRRPIQCGLSPWISTRGPSRFIERPHRDEARQPGTRSGLPHGGAPHGRADRLMASATRSTRPPWSLRRPVISSHRSCPAGQDQSAMTRSKGTAARSARLAEPVKPGFDRSAGLPVDRIRPLRTQAGGVGGRWRTMAPGGRPVRRGREGSVCRHPRSAPSRASSPKPSGTGGPGHRGWRRVRLGQLPPRPHSVRPNHRSRGGQRPGGRPVSWQRH